MPPSPPPLHLHTPVRSHPPLPQSAPPISRTHQLLTSPAAAQRSRASLEAFRVARTLKDGFLKLKARADPLSPAAPRRALSATTAAAPWSPRAPLARHHSEIPRLREFDRRRPDTPPLARSCPQRPRARLPARPEASRLPAPRFSLAPAPHPRDCTEVAEAAEAMILFMKSEPSSQTDPASPPAANPTDRPGSDTDSDTESVVLSDSDRPPSPLKRGRPASVTPEYFALPPKRPARRR
ncbi:hypothetical protein IWW51_001610 [Coemansia sp. RSA 2702]|nr:hypothetical protein IWW51_001610 [Coemansia sp. RSA 2702]